jgi:glutamate-ammonia-ligase adenylyltransferase
MRREWARCLIEVVAADVDGQISLGECKQLQTELAEASIQAAFWTMSQELLARYEIENGHIPLFALGLGKLGGGGIDYDSDLDLLMVYDDAAWRKMSQDSPAEFFAKSVEIFTTVLSSVTREGSLYRVDLRLRPYGSKGMAAISSQALLDYIRTDAEIWELLAFVMLRHVGGDPDSGEVLESELRNTIFDRASQVSKDELCAETRRIRLALEKQRGKTKRLNDVDIKYGSGALLDLYFRREIPAARETISQTIRQIVRHPRHLGFC